MTCLALLLRFALALPPWFQDAAEPIEQRAALYAPVIESACRVGRTDTERAWLLAQAYHETKLAKAVVLEECHLLGKWACDAGQAIGPWQPHRWCSAAWTAPTYTERLDAGARCALRQARTCKTPEGWFAVQGGRGRCKARWARARVPLMWRAMAALKGKP